MAEVMLRRVHGVLRIEPGRKLNLTSSRSKCDPEAFKCLVFVKLASILSRFPRLKKTARFALVTIDRHAEENDREALTQRAKTRND